MRSLPISEYPDVVPPSVVVRAQYPGANPQVIAETVATPLEEAINGVEGMLYMSSQATTDGLMTLTVTFKLGTDPDKAQQLVQNRVCAGRAAPARGSAAPRHRHDQELDRPDDGRAPAVAERPLRHDLPAQLRGAQRQDRLARASQGVGDVQLFGSGDYAMRVWLDPQKVAQRGHLGGRRGAPRSASQNVQAAAGVVGASPGVQGIDVQLSINAQGRLQSEEEFGDIIVKTGSDGAVTRLRDIAAPRARRGRLCAALAARQQGRGRGADLRRAGLESRSPSRTACARPWRSIKKAMPEGVDYEIVYDPTPVRARLDRVRGAHAARGDRAGGAGRHPVPADLARLDHPAAGGAGGR